MPGPTTPHRTASGSVDPAYFEQLYRDEPDPWGFDTSPYERAKYAATLSTLPRERYGSAFEVGCANGALTAGLATRCDALLAVDVADAALARARARCDALPHVRIRRMAIPGECPTETFDLVLISEVGYYLSRPDLARLVVLCTEVTASGGHLVLVHWTGPTDYPLTADDVHSEFLEAPGWQLVRAERHASYRLDVLERAAPHSQ